MNQATFDELASLRLPALRERYREVLGTETRCPNRVFLIRKITEALASDPESTMGTPPSTRDADRDDAESIASAGADGAEADVEFGAAERAMDSGQRDDAVLGAFDEEATAREARARRAQRRTIEIAPLPPPSRGTRGRFAGMNVRELRSLYLSVIGRPTGSTDKTYLVWKIREAEKGRVPVGPRQARNEGERSSAEARILPLRLDASAVDALDATWRAQGLPSRTEFLRRALGHYLAHLGAHGAAAMFGA
jgi:hypothetical protein